MSVPKLSSVLLQILLEFISCFAEVVGDVVVADQFTLSAVVDVVGVLIFVQDELEQICPFAEGTDEDMAISCDFHRKTSPRGGLPCLSSWWAICSHDLHRSSQSSIEVGVCRLPFMW